jgi:hypothetical protein
VSLDGKIDDLYRQPLDAFVTARNALAKTLTGDEAKRVRALVKPTVVPWAVNQVYWRARSTYDRLMKSGAKLREAQIAALEGRRADVRAAGEAHRRAIGEAVAEAERLAAATAAKPGADALARTFEALSLSTTSSQTPGRFTEALQPAGFEALLGVTPSQAQVPQAQVRSTKSEVRKLEVVKAGKAAAVDTRAAKAAAEAAAKEAAEKKKHDAAVKKAEEELARVEAAEQKARGVWERAHDDLLAARQALSDLRRSRFRST